MRIIDFMRLVFRIEAKISADQAVEIARQACLDNDWLWKEPIDITENLDTFKIKTNTLTTGGNAYFTISVSNGEILRSEIARR